MKTAALALILAGFAPQGDAVRPLPDRTRCRQAAAAKPWAKDLRQIPSTVIDKGVLRNVPYTSYRAGDYELNVYGDPAAPAGFEIGIHKELLKSAVAKKNETFFWDLEKKCFVGFQCGNAYDNAQVKCTICGKVPKRVRTKHR